MKHTIKDITATDTEFRMLHNRIGLFNSHFQNFKQFGIPKAQFDESQQMLNREKFTKQAQLFD